MVQNWNVNTPRVIPLTWHSADDVLDAEEDFDDELGDAGHDYADLAAAMGSPEAEEDSDEEEEETGDSDSEPGSGDHDLDVPSEDEEGDMALNDADSMDSGDDAMSGSDLDESDQEVDDEVNPFELAEATDSEDELGHQGTT